MNRVTPVVLAVITVTSLLAIPVASDPGADAAATAENPELTLQSTALQSQTDSILEASDTTNRLQLAGDVRTDRTEYGTDVALTLASFDSQLRIDREQYTIIDDEFATASVDERQRMIGAAHTRIQERTEELEDREQEAVRAHARGDLSGTELIRTLLRNQNEAAALYDALELLEDRTDDVPGYSLSHRQTRADKTLLEHHQTALRTTLERASQATGSEQGVDVRIQTSENGYSLAAIDGEMYLRETVRFDHRDADAPNQFEEYDDTYSETMDYAAELYPWAREQGWSSFSDSSNENIYTVSMEADRDQLEIHLDAGTGQVYREMQELSLAALPEDDTATWSNDEHELAVVQTPAHGPAKVTITEAGSDEPVTAAISIDGTEVGETNDDGTLWILPPADTYELTAGGDDGRLDATVTVSRN